MRVLFFKIKYMKAKFSEKQIATIIGIKQFEGTSEALKHGCKSSEALEHGKAQGYKMLILLGNKNLI